MWCAKCYFFYPKKKIYILFYVCLSFYWFFANPSFDKFQSVWRQSTGQIWNFLGGNFKKRLTTKKLSVGWIVHWTHCSCNRDKNPRQNSSWSSSSTTDLCIWCWPHQPSETSVCVYVTTGWSSLSLYFQSVYDSVDRIPPRWRIGRAIRQFPTESTHIHRITYRFISKTFIRHEYPNHDDTTILCLFVFLFLVTKKIAVAPLVRLTRPGHHYLQQSSFGPSLKISCR